MQRSLCRCNLRLPGNSNRVLVAVRLLKRRRAPAGCFRFFVQKLQSATAVWNVIRMVSTSGCTI
jgi:hypothetical protein